ncbi:MAG: hypothetical protein COA53_10010 [Rhodobacteraceae bacterium]|nr:MAG: hypothetical protein COA53_10010 [Paracoccaceae bacterium]
MLQFDITQYYSLFEVFERTGQLMFRDLWTGREIWSKPADDPNPVAVERDTLGKTLATALALQTQLNSIPQEHLTHEAKNNFNSDYAINYAEIDGLKRRLTELPQMSDSYIADFELFSRRVSVEQELWKAFTDKSLTAQLRSNVLADWRSWSHYPSFKVHYCLSMIIVPHHQIIAFRRSPAFVDKKAFLQWAERFGSGIYDDEQYAPKQRARSWLLEQVDKSGSKPYGKSRFIEEMVLKFGTPKREANRVWQEVVPQSWSKPGPVRKK